MKLDITIVQLALIFLPGILWASLDSRYAAKSERTQVEKAVTAFLFGVVAYVATFLLYNFVGRSFDIFEAINSGGTAINFSNIADEIISSTVVSFILALLWLYAATNKVLPKFLQKIGATKKYGDEDVWDYMFNSASPIAEYVYYRNFDKKIVYSGWVKVFSETEKLRELVLENVEVYDFDGNLMFETPLVYLSGDPEGMHIEFPGGREKGENQ